jgi:hypothetical protein
MIAVALFFTLYVPMASMQSRGLGVMTGQIRGHAGEQVAGGTVKFMVKSGSPIEATSNKDGRWRVAGIGKGEWTLLVTAPGYAARVIKLVVERESDGSEPVVTVLRKMSLANRD